MRLLLRDAVPGQKVNDRLGLDLEFSGQLVNANLVCFVHASYGPLHGQQIKSAPDSPRPLATRHLVLWLFLVLRFAILGFFLRIFGRRRFVCRYRRLAV